MFELLKEKNTGKQSLKLPYRVFLGCLIMLIMFFQIIGLIFEPDKYEWRDEFFLTFVVNVCNYCRIIKAISEAQSTFFYWTLMIFAMCYLAIMCTLLVYMNYFLKNRKHYVEQVVKLLRVMILVLFWVFYQPFFESFISIVKCENGYHYIDQSLECFSGIHIFYFVLCLIFLIVLVTMNLITAMLYNETQPVQEDCLSRLESSFEVALVVYRSIIATFSNFCDGSVCSWILISVYIIASIMVCYQYYKTIPFYNSFVSIFCGSLIYIYFWVSINALLMKLLQVEGHIIIIFIGIPFITLLVKNLREKRIENLMKTNIDKLKVDIDSLIQVHKMTDFARGINTDQAQRMTMIGIINIHIMECQNMDCPCKDEYELYDVSTNMFQERNKQAPHLDEVFLNHFIKRLYEDALNKFINSPSIHIAFAFYLFKNMKNIHASLVELNIAIKKKPSLQQQFTIFRYKNIIEEYIKQDHQEHKYVYPELTNVIEFERLFSEMQRSIEKVCNLQVEFWTHLTTVVPDQNILNELGKKIYAAAQEADFFWNQMCKINPNYQQALNIYGEYLREIRNHEHLGNTYIERGFNSMNAKKSIDEHAKTSDILFSPDTAVIHISGNKESIGKILKTSQGLSAVFGYSKTEVIGHSINILMPTLFAKRHTDLMERFFKTGRQVIFYQERTLFSTHRNGHCFQIKLLVKQMPTLSEGIQYVGMIRPIASDYEYMLTDMEGNIDSFSKGVTGMLGLTPNLFKDKDSQINIQILAPELITFFLETYQRGRAAKSKYRESGGDTLTLVVPRDFHIIAKSENKSNTRSGGRNRNGGGNRGGMNSNHRNRSQVFKQFLKALSKPGRIQRDRMPTAKMLMQQPEYVQCERRKEVQCEITCLDIKSSSTDSLKLLVFKFNKNEKTDKKKGDPLHHILMDYNEQEGQKNEANFDHFKQVSVVEESPKEKQQRATAKKIQIQHYNDQLQQEQQQQFQSQDSQNNRRVNFEPQQTGYDRNLAGQSINVNAFGASNNGQIIQKQDTNNNQVQNEPISQLQIQQQQSDQIQNQAPKPPIAPPSARGQPSTFKMQSIKSNAPPGITPSGQMQGTLKSIGGQESVKLPILNNNSISDNNNRSPSKTGSLANNQMTADKQSQSFSSHKSMDQDSEDSEALRQQQQLKAQLQQIQKDKQQQQLNQMQQQRQKQQQQQQEEELESLKDEEDVVTPRLDVSGIKLESAQKEKNSFLDELKKQSFIFSENSTVKMDAKDSVLVGDKAKQEQKSFSNPQNQANAASDSADKKSNSLSFLLEADQLVKKQNQNNIRVVFQGDDLEPIETVENFTEEQNDQDNHSDKHDSEGSQSGKGTQKSKKSKTRSGRGSKSQAEESGSEEDGDDDNNDDDEEEEDEDEDAEDQHDPPTTNQTKSKESKKSRKRKSARSSAYDSEENEEDYEEDSKESDDDESNRKSNARSSGKGEDKQPLLPQVMLQPTQSSKMALDSAGMGGLNPNSNLMMPNMNDFKRGFGNDDMGGKGDDYLLPDPRQLMLGGRTDSSGQRQRSISGNESLVNGPTGRASYFKKMSILKRDTQKIKTNPKYRCVDDGSEDENDTKNHINDEQQNMSSKEAQFRDNLLKYEKRKKRKERKQKEKEMKKLKAMNGDDSTAGGITAAGDAVASQSSEEEDITSSESSSTSSEESKDEKGNTTAHHNTKGGNNANSKLTKKGPPRSNNDEGDVSSVTTRQNKTERSHYNLRMAIDEKFIPNSIKNLRYAAYLIFIVLSLLAIVYYVLQIQLFDKINQNISNIHNSEQRINYIIDITLRTRTLILINNGYYPGLSPSDKATLIASTVADLRDSATNLKNAQTDLSLQTSSLDSDQLQQINPDNVVLQYLQYPNMPNTYTFSIWEAIMEIVVSAYRISTSAITEMNDNNPTAYFIINNCLNSVLEALNSSTDAIMSESDSARTQNLQVFLYLLIAASCALFLSLLFLIPVINKIKKSKQEVLKLFTHKNVEKHIDDQLKICRNFVSTRLQQNNEGGEHDIEGDDVGGAGGVNVNDKELQNELNNNKYMKRIRKKNKGKKLKELNTDFGSTLLKFLIFLSIIEGYFLANYLLSQQFLSEVSDLTEELKLLISRQPVQSFLLLIEMELIYTNGTELIEGEAAVTYVPTYQEAQYDQEEQLLDQFSSNYDYHSSSYNDDFNNIIYSDVCQYVDYDNFTTCESFNQGILQKGIYSSVIKYWDFLRQINHDFMESDRSNSTIIQFLNDNRLTTAQQMQEYYFKLALTQLVSTLEADIDNFFNVEYVQNRTIFIVYILYLAALYFLIWRKYMSYMSNELWKTKSMLSVLPTKLCFETEEIRSFINKNSSNDILSTIL